MVRVGRGVCVAITTVRIVTQVYRSVAPDRRA
ncbi:hypothetical protein HNR00_004746 [Methylorubrum rhodinum]|uniref:Uncharacterized protein n=1 Tax=Methylorubrum rhodinum TaxID=29428 RepID=A0A840ZQX2_9HYPH|nr:hypothetical protein [Methylorubrum rhodinum]